MSATEPLLIEGEIVFEDDEFPILVKCHANCKISVQLEDVTMVDASSMVVKSQTIDAPNLNSNGILGKNKTFVIPFKLFCDIVDNQRRYEISVHVDMDGDNKVGIGDYINTQSYPVITQGYPTHISVKVTRIS
jgi:uncharacterized lipoprotein YbaY